MAGRETEHKSDSGKAGGAAEPSAKLPVWPGGCILRPHPPPSERGLPRADGQDAPSQALTRRPCLLAAKVFCNSFHSNQGAREKQPENSWLLSKCLLSARWQPLCTWRQWGREAGGMLTACLTGAGAGPRARVCSLPPRPPTTLALPRMGRGPSEHSIP